MIRLVGRCCRVLPGLVLLGAVSCDKDSAPSASFDRGPLLENIGNEIIIPAYEALANGATSLEEAAQEFTGDPAIDNLSSLRTSWLSAYVAFQHCGFFAFGPADQMVLNPSLNTFPTSKIEVDGNISSGSYNLEAISSNDAKGFSALDYLLYGIAETDEAIIDLYTTDPEANKRKQYLLDVAADIRSRSEEVYSEWSADDGNYIATFISQTGVDVGSSVGLFLNETIQYLERDLRDGKIGIPLGIRSLGVPIPENCEALHAEESILLASESTKALQNIYLGRGDTNGIGFDDYLSAINARYNGGSLDEAIRPQLDLVVASVEDIPEPYSETVTGDNGDASDAYQELQKLVILLKTDMMSALGVLITYQDNDGD